MCISVGLAGVWCAGSPWQHIDPEPFYCSRTGSIFTSMSFTDTGLFHHPLLGLCGFVFSRMPCNWPHTVEQIFRLASFIRNVWISPRPPCGFLRHWLALHCCVPRFILPRSFHTLVASTFWQLYIFESHYKQHESRLLCNRISQLIWVNTREQAFWTM